MLPRLCTSGTVVCLASGPSLVAEDVDYVRWKATVIAINDAIRLAPWADVLYSSDKGWWLSHIKKVRDLPALKVAIHASLSKPTSKPVDGRHCPGCRLRLPASGTCWCVGLVTMNNAGFSGLSMDPTALVNGHNSGSAAINVAVHLGAQRIVLLGYDMGADERGRRHFFDTGATICTSPFDKFRKLTATMVEPLKALGVEVINCSRRTRLECFPCRPLREVL
jgi:hypothetical protein